MSQVTRFKLPTSEVLADCSCAVTAASACVHCLSAPMLLPLSLTAVLSSAVLTGGAL